MPTKHQKCDDEVAGTPKGPEPVRVEVDAQLRGEERRERHVDSVQRRRKLRHVRRESMGTIVFRRGGGGAVGDVAADGVKDVVVLRCDGVDEEVLPQVAAWQHGSERCSWAALVQGRGSCRLVQRVCVLIYWAAGHASQFG
jgi:hypothetical protein